ncbi:hypothetical protein TWF694_003546 [Orbilia ellipsospora]|uniref:AAA+ ATPase domain-containing protein n=1 Tax=Orbilia ellipsospora TaxID=2528407 RepID=A0AAV9WZP1_9PEZI
MKLLIQGENGEQYEIPLTSLSASTTTKAIASQKAAEKKIVNGFKVISDTSESESSDKEKNTKEEKGEKGEKEENDENDEKEEKKERGSVLEYKRLDNLYDNKTYQFYLTETKTPEDHKEDKYECYVFVVRRVFNRLNDYEHTVVDIKSLKLKAFFQEAFKNVHGLSWHDDKPTFTSDFLFIKEKLIEKHLLSLKKLGSSDPDSKTTIEEAELLLQYIEADYKEIRANLERHAQEKTISYDLLQYIMYPEVLVAFKNAIDDLQVAVIKSAKTVPQDMKPGTCLRLEISYICHDGKDFIFQNKVHLIPEFEGVRPIASLSIYPFESYSKYGMIREELIERGKKFIELNTPDIPGIPGAYRFYQGLAYYIPKDVPIKMTVKGRVMIDSLAYQTGGHVSNLRVPHKMRFAAGLIPIDDYSDDEFGKTMPRDKDRVFSYEGIRKPEEMTDEELLLCDATVDGFSFGDNMWLHFATRCLEKIQWNQDAFNSLVLPANHKKVIRALIESHTKGPHQQTKVIFDDIIQGKGRGLVVLLHGKPGLGKTLTAESISETLKRPLYAISSGDLPTEPSQLEHSLTKTLNMASAWGAVLLIDEADIYLSQRSLGGDIRRDALVCVFLRRLEYFQGIIVLTSNRVTILDEAFQSRIHVALAYEDLGRDAKIQIWKFFIKKAVESETGLELTDTSTKDRKAKKWATSDTSASALSEEDYEHLARYNFNGRQIKNIVHSSHCVAAMSGEHLNLTHIKEAIQVAEDFERSFKGPAASNFYT